MTESSHVECLAASRHTRSSTSSRATAEVRPGWSRAARQDGGSAAPDGGTCGRCGRPRRRAPPAATRRCLSASSKRRASARLDQGDAADHLVLEHQRLAQHGAFLAPTQHGAAGPVAGIALHPVAAQEHGGQARQLAQARGQAGALTFGGAGLRRPDRGAHHGLGVAVVLVEVALPHVDGLGDAARYGGKQVLEHERRGDHRAHFARQPVRIVQGCLSPFSPRASPRTVPISAHGRKPPERPLRRLVTPSARQPQT